MNLNEKNFVLALALDDINYIVTENNAGNNPGDIKKQYDCNKAAFDQIAKVIANAMRLDLIGGDLPAGTHFTPEAVRKFAEEQSKKDATPIDPNGPTLNQILANPPLTGFAKFLSLPALGIQFRRYTSANMTKLIATWRDDANDHVYEISVQRDGDTPNCGWRATATNDGHNVFQLRTKGRANCEHLAFSAMKRYLKRGHRKTYRKLAKAKKDEK